MDQDWIHRTPVEHAEAKAAAEQFNLTDALGEHARKLRRNCMAWSALLFALTYYRLPLKSVPVWNIEIPSERAATVLLLVAVPLVYSLVGFVIQAGADLTKWRLSHLTKLNDLAGNALHRMAEHIRVIKMYRTGEYPARPGLTEEEIRKVLKNASDAMDASSSHIMRMYSHARAVSRGRKIFAYAWEMFVPIAVAAGSVLYAADGITAALLSFFET